MPTSFLFLFFYEYPSVDEFWLYVFLPEFYCSGFMGGIRCRNKNDSEIIMMITQQSWPSCKLPKTQKALEAIYSMLWKRPKVFRWYYRSN